MRCVRCHQETPPDAVFCPQCGAKLSLACPRCGAASVPDDNFCRKCGERLPAARDLVTRFASPDTYTPKHLVEKILTSKRAVEGERKQVTVLFADLKGSMELLADRDPEEARTILDPVLERMMDAVHRYEGTVNQVMGDGIMALFGAPLAHEDHAVRACYAALRMQESVKQYAEELPRTEGTPIHIRVGLNSGEVVVRSIGSDLRMDYTAVGQTTHLAARMEQNAWPGSIFIARETFKLAEPYIRARPLGPVAIKGFDAPTETYELQGIAPARSGLQSVATRSLTRFVGRDSELQQLRRALERARSAGGQVVGVVGEPGVGKTRLSYEFARSPFMHEWVILATSAMSYGRGTPYLPVVELLKAYFKLEDQDHPREIRQQIIGKLLSLGPAFEQTLPVFQSLLELPVDDAEWLALDPPQRRERILDALRNLVLRQSQVQPLCLIVENLHWIDSETQAFLDRVVDGLPSHRILLLVNYRPEYRHRWGPKTYFTQFRIDPLDGHSVEEIVRDLLGADPEFDALKELLTEKTEGNPFFLEECLRTLVETRVLIGQPGAYRLTAPVRSIHVPATVQAVLAARIDRLAPDEKELLQSAAVIGKNVPLTTLQMIARCPEDALHQGLARLQAAEFLYGTRSFPDLEYTFKHALTHEVAYGSLLQNIRREIHARIVEAMEAADADRATEQVERLAYHAFQGEVWDKAVTYLRQAGAKAFAQAAHREAAARLSQALVAIERLPKTRTTIEQAIDLRLSLRNSLLPVGEVPTVLRHLREAETLAASLHDRRRAGWISGYLSACSWSLGDYAAGLDSARQAHRLAVALGDVPLRIYASTALTWPYHSLGQYRAGIASAAEAVDLLDASPGFERFDIPSRPAVLARTWLVSCLVEVGEFARATPLAMEAVRLAEATGEPWSLVDAYLGVGILELRRGHIPAATAILTKGLDVSRKFHVDVWFPPLASSLGYAAALSGNLPEALPLLERAVQQATTTGLRFYHSLSVMWLAEAYRLAGRGVDARQRAVEALELCERYQEAGNRAHTLRILGEIVAQAGDDGEAERRYLEALGLAAELEMRPLAAQCRLGLGQLAGRRGQGPEAREQLAAALELFSDLEMEDWIQRARAALQGVPSIP